MKRKEPAHLEDPTQRASSSSASSSSTSPHVGDCEGGAKKPRGNNYEVFLSFRGKDTREGFTDFLYTSLVDAGIHVFRDDNELRVGEEIGPELLCSITQSKISIPIISEDYSSSKWCLRELAHMLNCRKSHGQLVLPIFYKVEPSQLRHLSGRLGDAIYAHKQNMDEKVVKEWEEALKEVSSLKGWESNKMYNGLEGALVKLVVGNVMSELKRKFQLTLPKELVGLGDRVEEIVGLMDAKFEGTRIMGIYGMGGIGKTTLAKVLYNNLSGHFEHFSFLTNIRETYASKGIECLQKQLICDILRSPYDVSNFEEGIGIIRSRFISKKVLIVLDDIDDNTHLKALAGDKSWFGAGSIVIMTTRNKSILRRARASHFYKLEGLPVDQSLILFSRHAFQKDSPQSEYENITRDVVSTTGGLPLALEVIGSFLYGQTKEVWKDTLRKLNKVPDKEVQEKLKISYDALDYEEKQIFLDIACFFIGSQKQSPTYMWDACGFYPAKGLEVLSLLSLIKIDEDDKLMMHDQLRDLGREIVRQENLKELQERSRLWNKKEALDVLDNNKGTRKIEALCSEGEWRRRYIVEQFKELTNLRFLQLSGGSFTGDFQDLLPQLKWLQWWNCPSNFAATNFCPKKLVVLDLSRSKITEDWGGWGPLKMATELKILNLTDCHFLRRIPELSAFKSLEILILNQCYELEEIHPSVGDIKTLISLRVNSCRKLKELPAGVGRMEELRELVLDYTAIKDIPVSRGCLMKLETLSAWKCTKLARLPESMGSLVSLTRLNLSCCESLAHVPSSIGHLTSLSVLCLSGCGNLAQQPVSIGSLTSLTQLHLASSAIAELPEGIVYLQKLRILNVSGTGVTELPRDIGILAKLQKLYVSRCENLEGLPDSIGELRSLNMLELDESGISGLPQSISRLSSLQFLSFQFCEKLHEIPELPSGLTALGITCQSPPLPHLSQLTLLNKLTFSDCGWLECLPELPVGLSMLRIIDCGKLKALTDFSYLKHLSELTIEKCLELTEVTGLEGLESLIELELSGCTSLRHSLDLSNVKNLQIFNAADCDKLVEIRGLDGLESLIELQLSGCTSLRHSLDLSNVKNLQIFNAADCEKLVEIRGLDGSESLIELELSGCTSLRKSPDQSSLKNLVIFNGAYLPREKRILG